MGDPSLRLTGREERERSEERRREDPPMLGLHPSVSAIDRALNDVVSSTMTCSDIIALLTNHNCTDLTPSLNEAQCSKYPVATGGLGDIFRGQLIDGTTVAIKTIRAYGQSSNSLGMYQKRAAKEIYTWSKCKHPNVVQLQGLVVFRGSLAMISSWEENGNLLHYLSHYPNADRCKLSTSICEGLSYLHKNDIVHGDLKGANVLMAQDGRPMLMDFGNARLLDSTLQFTQNSTGPNYSIRWTAPEILRGKSGHTMAGDVYALGMTILEALTGEIPFPNKQDTALYMHVVINKKIHQRPKDIIPENSIYGNVVWAILVGCWSYNPARRPTAECVWGVMKHANSGSLKEIIDEPED